MGHQGVLADTLLRNVSKHTGHLGCESEIKST